MDEGSHIGLGNDPQLERGSNERLDELSVYLQSLYIIIVIQRYLPGPVPSVSISVRKSPTFCSSPIPLHSRVEVPIGSGSVCFFRCTKVHVCRRRKKVTCSNPSTTTVKGAGETSPLCRPKTPGRTLVDVDERTKVYIHSLKVDSN